MPYCNDLFYRCYESGETERGIPPLVLLHGSGGSHMAWPVEMRRWRGLRVIALDLPGHGQSTGAACQSLDALVNCLRRFLQDCGIREVLLAGHSLGAILALTYASVYSSHVRGMALLSCGCRFAIPPELFDALLQPSRKAGFVELFSRLAFDPSFPQSRRRAILEPLAKMRSSTLFMDVGICSDFRVTGNLEKVQCPVMLINGASDLITIPASARQLAYCLPEASITILPRCGHLLLYEKTTLINQMMRDFLSPKRKFVN